MSIAYDGDPPGFVGVHYGGDGIGISGALVPVSGELGPSIIAKALEHPGPGVDLSAEYRLVASSIPSGVVINENGSGTFTAETSVTCFLFKDGVEQ